MEIRYLNQEEKDRSRKLWKQCFPEDSERFLAYYYEEKCRDNQILVLEEHADEENRIQAMLQRNPYEIRIPGAVSRLDYIVGVATAPERRHRGYMRKLLGRMMEDQHWEQMPFTFLMPADPEIYRPFGFAYVYDQPRWRLKKEAAGHLQRIAVGSEAEAKKAGVWLEQWLESRYEIYARRDGEYMARLWKEIRSEYGSWELLYAGDRLVGMECFWGKEQRERRFLYAEEDFLEEEKEPAPAIMARIINLEEFMAGICLKEEAAGQELELHLGILDPQLPENQGFFSWDITEDGSYIHKLGEEIPEGTWTVTISQLTQWLLGYGGPEKIFGEDPALCRAGIWEKGFSRIQPINGVFLDEVV